MLTEIEMEALMEMLGRASLEQLDAAWGKVIMETQERRFMVPSYMKTIEVSEECVLYWIDGNTDGEPPKDLLSGNDESSKSFTVFDFVGEKEGLNR